MAEENTFNFNPTPPTEEQNPPTIADFTAQQQGADVSSADSFSQGMFQTVENYSKNTSKVLNNPTFGGATTYIDPNQINKYTSQESFDPFTFDVTDPTANQLLIDREDWGSAMGKAFDGFAYNFGNTFADYWKSYGRMGEAIASMDWDLLRPDEETLIDTYYKDQQNMNKNFVFVNPEDEDSIFSKKFVADTVSNAGFALGTFAGIGIELAADVLITYASGGLGAGTFVATLGRVGTKLGLKKAAKEGVEAGIKSGFQFGDTVSEFVKGYQAADKGIDELTAAGKVASKIDEAAEAAKLGNSSSARTATINETFAAQEQAIEQMLKGKSFSEMIGKGLDYIPLVGTGFRYGEKIVAASKAGAGIAQLSGMGLKGGYRIAQELNLASTEASFEAVSTYGDTLDRMVQEYRMKNNGENPTPEEFAKMQQNASSAAGANYNTNLAILLGTNKIQFGNLFTKFSPANKFARELLEESSERILAVEGKAFSKVYQKGITGAYGQLGNIAKDFGKREALYQFGKAFAKDALRFEVSEGIQENLQEASASAWKDYYANKYAGIEKSLGEVFEAGIGEQFTKQGFKTFVMGAITGTIVRMPTALASRGLEKLQNAAISSAYKGDAANDPVKQAQTQFKQSIDKLNGFLKSAGDRSFDHNTTKLLNFSEQVNAAQGMTSAASQGKRYEFENHRDNALMSAITSAKALGTIDVLQRSIENMGSKMSVEEFEKSFGLKLEDTKYNSVQEFTSSLSRDIKKYSDTYDGIRRKVGTMIDPLVYKEGSRNRFVATMARMQQEEIAHVIASNAIKGDMTVNRSQQIAKELRSNPIIGASADEALRILSKGTNVVSEIGNIDSEIKLLEQNLKGEGLTPELTASIKEQIKAKEKERDLLEEWKNQFEIVEEEVEYTDAEGNKQKVKQPKLGNFKGQYVKGKPINKGKKVGYDLTVVPDELEESDIDPQQNYTMLNMLTEYFNLKNKQAGLGTAEITVTEFGQHFDKIIDYIRLEDDVKTYMQNVDLLFNPQQFIGMIGRMTDGNFKHKVLQYLSFLPHQIMASVKEAENLLNITNIVEFAMMSKKLNDILFESAPYKNLMTLAMDPNMSIENSEYVKEQADAIAELLADSLMDIIESESGISDYQDIEDADFNTFEVNGNISYKYLYEIAKKNVGGVTLTDKETKVYDVYKDQIETIMDRIAGKKVPQQPPQTPPPAPGATSGTAAAAPGTPATPAGSTLGNDALRDKMRNILGTVRAKLDPSINIASSARTIEDRIELIIDDLIVFVQDIKPTAKVATSNEVVDMLQDSSISAVTVHILKQSRSTFMQLYRAVEEEYLNGTLNTGAPANPGATATSTSSSPVGVDLKLSQLKPGDTIDNRDSQGTSLQIKSIDTAARTVTVTDPTLGFDDVKTFDEIAADYQVEVDIPVNPAPAGTPTNPGGPAAVPYTVKGDATIKFSVIDPTGAVMMGGIDTEERAQALVDSLNKTANDIEFVRNEFYEDVEDPNIIGEFISRANAELAKYNAARGTTVASIEEFNKVSKGARTLRKIFDSMEEEFSPSEEATVPEVVVSNPATAPDTVDNSTSIISADAIEVDSNFADIMDIANEVIQESEESSKFVGGDIQSTTSTEASLLDILKNSQNCNS